MNLNPLKKALITLAIGSALSMTTQAAEKVGVAIYLSLIHI